MRTKPQVLLFLGLTLFLLGCGDVRPQATALDDMSSPLMVNRPTSPDVAATPVLSATAAPATEWAELLSTPTATIVVQMPQTLLKSAAFSPEMYVSPLLEYPPAELTGYGKTAPTAATLTVATPVAHEIPVELCAPFSRLTHSYGSDCAEKIEALQLTAGLPNVMRQGNQLRLVLANGKIETYTDAEGRGGGGWAFYHYINYLPELDAYLLHIQYYEGSAYLLVSNSGGDGKKWVLPSPPLIAPDGRHFVTMVNRFESSLVLQLWHIVERWAAPDMELRFEPVPLFSGAVQEIAWVSPTLLQMATVSQGGNDYPPATVTVLLDEPISAKYNGEPIHQPAIDRQPAQWNNYAIHGIERAAVGKLIYADRDYHFTALPTILQDQQYFLFANNEMHDNTGGYARFYLYQPATLYAVIDEQACALPAWLADWSPVAAEVTTTDSGLKLYQKAFPIGEVLLGGNEMPPAACIRSHYLLFLVEADDLPSLTRTAEWAGMEQHPWSDVSPDGTWVVEGLTALPSQSGNQYYMEMHVKEVDGSLTWTPIARWSPFGLGYTTPRIVHWSADGRYLYFTNAPHPDGCGLFINASDLQRLDLTTGTVDEILPMNSTWILAAAPNGTVAYSKGDKLHLLDPTTRNEVTIPLDMLESGTQWGNFVWSPDSQQLAFTVAHAPCMPPAWEQAIYTVERQGENLRLVLPEDERRFQIVDWIDDTHLSLVDFENHPWVLELVTGQLREASK